jgi:hypothetical protein
MWHGAATNRSAEVADTSLLLFLFVVFLCVLGDDLRRNQLVRER